MPRIRICDNFKCCLRCSSGIEPTTEVSTEVFSPGLSTLASVNLDSNNASIREAIDAGLLSGAVTMVWQSGKVLQVNELGYRDVEARLPMRRDTMFRIASMTKPITVAAAMSLVDEGRLALTDPVTKWLPEMSHMQVVTDVRGPLDHTVPAERPITIDDLMTHRSGLAYAFSIRGPLSRAYGKLSHQQDQDSWLADLAKLPLAHQPGARLTYGVSTDVLGIVLSRIEDRPLPKLLSERIFEPLGMPDTGFSVGPTGRQRAATMYALSDDGTLHHNSMGPARITDPPLCTGGTGLWSTADDYLRFARMLLAGGKLDGNRVISAESTHFMRTDRLTDEQKRYPFLGNPYWIGRGFGLNLSVVTDPEKSRQLFGPGGRGTFTWPGAYGTWWQADPSADLILIYMIQNHPDMSSDAAAAVAGSTSVAKLQSVQPKFVRRTYRVLQG